MTLRISNMKAIYQKLSNIGFSEEYIRNFILPNWWNQEFEQTGNTAPLEAAVYISRRLNLSLDSLLKPNAIPVLNTSYQFKNYNERKKQPIYTYLPIIGIAEMIAYATVQPYSVHSFSAKNIRTYILQNNEVVHLEGLLQWCWHQGIPVFYLPLLPENTFDFHGMIIHCPSRPVIAINYDCFLSKEIILAHELGHLLNQHVLTNHILNESIDLSSTNEEEVEADVFVEELFNLDIDDYKNRIIYNTKINNYKLKTSGYTRSVPEVVNRYLLEKINWNNLSDDNQEYLKHFLSISIFY